MARIIRSILHWPWKSESAKECVTTHLPNELALKIDGAEVYCRYSTISANSFMRH